MFCNGRPFKPSLIFVSKVRLHSQSTFEVLPPNLDYCGLYYKHVTIINYASSGVNKLKASHNDDARVVNYDRHMFIVQATGLTSKI